MGCGSTRIHTTPVSNGKQNTYADYPLVRRSHTQFSHLSATIQNDEERVKVVMSPDCSSIQIETVSFGSEAYSSSPPAIEVAQQSSSPNTSDVRANHSGTDDEKKSANLTSSRFTKGFFEKGRKKRSSGQKSKSFEDEVRK
ncbi:unnamed protein product [Dimorphilus gyrociliatus]|uniref:Uncharacterized protein n=1 Tax=Dimorphilus gyrociliatus TaxID=2664684 RepID=A0A7I8WD01_9ANNE|nr:unnamed protein product [Dimorphilus gyrociliatus]